jgi:lipoate-protein ligase A
MNKITCKVHISQSNNPYHNLAVEELLLSCVKPDEVLLYLWQNDNTVVIGRNQNAWRECKLEAFQAQKGHLARRLSGGGAVYHDMGNQNFTFVAHKDLYDVARQSDVICQAVNLFGIKAERSGRNDIIADGRKFSGNAFYSNGIVNYHHGTILIASNMSKLGEFLTPSKEKLQAKGVQSVRSRVVNLSELMPDITPEAIRKALITSFQEIYQGELQAIDETVLNERELQKLSEHYESKEWTLGHLSEFNQQFHTRLSFGEVEVQLYANNGRIEDAKVYSDAMNADWAELVASALCGALYHTSSIKASLEKMEVEKENTMELYDYLESVML